MKTPSSFIKLKGLSDNEIYSHPETDDVYSWQGCIDKITDDDIKHLQEGKPLMLVVAGEYICVIKKDN